MIKQTRIAIYARVSTAEQAEEGFSIDAQEEMIRKACDIQGKEIVRVYADRGISGKSTKDRLALQDMMEDSTKGIFDEVMVWKTSRLARNILDLLQIVNTLEKNNVTFRSLSEPYDTSTPQGKLMMNMLASFAEFERTTIIDNLRLGMNARARQGLKNGGRLFGYRSEGEGRENGLQIVPDEAEVVRMIFRMYSEGQGYKAIANHLNKLGYKTVKGNLFSINTVKGILDNPTYVGKIRFNRYVDYSSKRRKGANENIILSEGRHDPIIDEETWEKVRLIQEKKSGQYSTQSKGKFPLSGILRCPECGAGMVASNTVNTLKDGTKKRIRYYSCGNFQNKGSVACSANSVRADYAEEYVFSRIQEVLINENVLKDLVKNINKDRDKKVKPLSERKNVLETKLKESQVKKDRVFEAYEDNMIDKKTLAQRLSIIDTNIDEQQKELEKIKDELLHSSIDEISFELIRAVMVDFGKLMESAMPEQRKLFLQLVVDKITVKKGKIKEINICFNQAIKGMIGMYLNKEEEPSDDGGSSSFVFAVAI